MALLFANVVKEYESKKNAEDTVSLSTQVSDLFDVIDGEDCIKDILNFVYNIDKCDNYNLLQENTMLQKLIKKKLMNGNKFYLGLGILNNNNLL